MTATVKVAVVDTGFDVKSTWPNAVINGFSKPVLCPNQYNFVNNSTDITDNHGHGTHIAGLITKYAGNESVCLLILKYYDPKDYADNLYNSTRALRYAIDQKVDIINYSGGGIERDNEECDLIKKALDRGIKVVAAAGNDEKDLDKQPYYPALCDNRVIVVGNYNKDGVKHSSANYSTKRYNIIKEQGVNVMSLLPNNSYGLMTGTSQATAITTGKLVQEVGKIKKLYSVEVAKLLKKHKRKLASKLHKK